jgi:hypothetical protein
MVEVAFTDNGPGIKPAEMSALFVPFHTTKEGGTGLGLPISQRIVEHHGGRIIVESAPGKGATFTVRLPVRPGTALPAGSTTADHRAAAAAALSSRAEDAAATAPAAAPAAAAPAAAAPGAAPTDPEPTPDKPKEAAA